MLKTSLVFVFVFPLYILIFNFRKKYILNYLNILLFFITFAWFLKNIIISGCLIYPIEVTCIETLQWFSNNLDRDISQHFRV